MALATVCEADEYMYTKIGNQKWFVHKMPPF